MKRQAILSLLVALTAVAVAPASVAQTTTSTASVLFSRTYTAGDGSAYSALYRIRPSGQDIVPLTSARVGINYHPGSWSPKGNSIVFETLRADRTGRSQLYVVDREGGSMRRITSGLYMHQQPSWGPNGIAFISDRGNHDLCLSMVLADGQGQHDLFCPNIFDRPTEPMRLSTPTWAPSGKSVVFEAAAYQDNLDGDWVSHVYRVNVTTGAVVELTRQHIVEQTALAVAPDTTHGIYAFVYADYQSMYLVDFATGIQTRVDGSGWSPHYSRDGSQIAFDRKTQVYVMDADGTNIRPVIAIPDPAAEYSVAAWSWDSTRLLVNKTGTKSAMQIVDLATGAARNVAAGSAADQGWFHD